MTKTAARRTKCDMCAEPIQKGQKYDAVVVPKRRFTKRHQGKVCLICNPAGS